ncbi:hypothetical protein NP233_g8153 [Leucocoprinus birnbaumii]|uniref:TEA domain-containing protein n=1 Tax=Leucocoprinus birnbaumii TaxID=56174 RepID=A0AAD5VN12_9AGAR|nr:hypothetical protein NP233_g8153 [Leucocoprinus birnbaumii]
MYLNNFQVQGDFESRGSTADTITTQKMTIDELSLTYSAEESFAVIQQRDATGCRCNKTIKGRGEAVWPPSLEAALIGGLQSYSVRHRVHMRHRGCLIGRNHFLSNYVKSVTGKQRTAKQVGSRLQQLKDTCRELDILYLITGSHSFSPTRKHRQGSKSSSRSSSQRSVSSSPELSDGAFGESEEPYFIDATPEHTPPVKSPQSVLFPTTPDSSHSLIYELSNQRSSITVECNAVQYYASSQCHSDQNEWTCGSQTQTSMYYAPTQQWGNYYSMAVTQQQQQYAYYDSQYY